jgi:hypothetical protein
MSRVSGDPAVDWLLEEENPSVRYFTLTKLLGEAEDSPAAAKARRAIMKTGPVPAILEKRNPLGVWSEPGRAYEDKYTGTVWQIFILAELGTDGTDPRVRKACQFLLDSSQDPSSGGFSAKESARGAGGLPSYVIPCLTGNMVFALARLGMGEDPRVRAAADWIGRFQRFDDGDTAAPRTPFYDRFEMCWGRHSCHMGVVKALKGLSALPPSARGAKGRAAARAGVEYLMAHRIHKRSHDLSQVSRPGWLKFGFPLMYQTDVLEILWILADLGARDARAGEALEVVARARGKDGRWTMRNSFNGKTLVDIEEKGKPSKWITLRALRVLAAA